MATDFIGFTIGGRHSSTLGIYHVSGGDRYEENLLPASQDKTVQVPGGDGTYYFGSYYTQNSFSLNVAFDNLSETQFRELRKVLGNKNIQDLIFDERPYKVYKVKATGTPQLKYICFDNPRVYKGEGTFQFNAYDPFAHCPNEYKYQSKYVPQTSESSAQPPWYHTANLTEWSDAAGLLPSQTTHGSTYDSFATNAALLYNPGDMPTDFKVHIGAGATRIVLSSNSAGESAMNILEFTAALPEDVDLDSKLNLLTTTSNGITVVRNNYIKSGAFFKIPQVTTGALYLVVNGGSGSSLQYDYLYF